MAFISGNTGIRLGNTGDVTTDIQTQLASTQEMLKKVLTILAIVAVVSWILMSSRK